MRRYFIEVLICRLQLSHDRRLGVSQFIERLNIGSYPLLYQNERAIGNSNIRSQTEAAP